MKKPLSIIIIFLLFFTGFFTIIPSIVNNFAINPGKLNQSQIPIEDKLTNAVGLVHGGAIFSAADSAVGMALVGLTHRDENISTLEMKINYMKPVKGGEILAEATILHRGSQTAVGDVEVRDEDRNLIAKGLGTYAIYKKGLLQESKSSATKTR